MTMKVPARSPPHSHRKELLQLFLQEPPCSPNHPPAPHTRARGGPRALGFPVTFALTVQSREQRDGTRGRKVGRRRDFLP